jgi:Rrf2 family protein
MRQTATTLDLPVPFSVGSGYALLALAVLPEDGRFSVAADLAHLLGLPGPFLAKVLKALAQEGILESQRGPGGGFRLARPAHCITVQDVVAAIEGGAALHGCLMRTAACREHPCVLHHALVELKAQTDQILYQVTIRDLQIRHLRNLREQAEAKPALNIGA